MPSCERLVFKSERVCVCLCVCLNLSVCVCACVCVRVFTMKYFIGFVLWFQFIFTVSIILHSLLPPAISSQRVTYVLPNFNHKQPTLNNIPNTNSNHKENIIIKTLTNKTQRKNALLFYYLTNL